MSIRKKQFIKIQNNILKCNFNVWFKKYVFFQSKNRKKEKNHKKNTKKKKNLTIKKIFVYSKSVLFRHQHSWFINDTIDWNNDEERIHLKQVYSENTKQINEKKFTRHKKKNQKKSKKKSNRQ